MEGVQKLMDASAEAKAYQDVSFTLSYISHLFHIMPRFRNLVDMVLILC